MTTFKHAAVGGTFDHFHKGHEEILKTAFTSAKKVTIGISSDNLTQKKLFKNSLEGFEVRKKNVIQFLKKNSYYSRSQIIILNDIYGPAIDDRSFDVIVVSNETRKTAVSINKLRKKKSLPPLKIVSVPFVKAEDKRIIRSSRIRKGEINQEGTYYLYLFKKKNALHLPHNMKHELRKPLGTVIKGDDSTINETILKVKPMLAGNKYPLLISVGDVVSDALTKSNIIPDIQIIDKKTRRMTYKHTNSIKTNSYSKNSAGKIQKQAVLALSKKIKTVLDTGKKDILLIRGEEDLMALPTLLLSPLHSLVMYGQTDVGVILVTVTMEIKKKVELLLQKFS